MPSRERRLSQTPSAPELSSLFARPPQSHPSTLARGPNQQHQQQQRPPESSAAAAAGFSRPPLPPPPTFPTASHSFSTNPATVAGPSDGSPELQRRFSGKVMHFLFSNKKAAGAGKGTPPSAPGTGKLASSGVAARGTPPHASPTAAAAAAQTLTPTPTDPSPSPTAVDSDRVSLRSNASVSSMSSFARVKRGIFSGLRGRKKNGSKTDLAASTDSLASSPSVLQKRPSIASVDLAAPDAPQEMEEASEHSEPTPLPSPSPSPTSPTQPGTTITLPPPTLLPVFPIATVTESQRPGPSHLPDIAAVSGNWGWTALHEAPRASNAIIPAPSSSNTSPGEAIPSPDIGSRWAVQAMASFDADHATSRPAASPVPEASFRFPAASAVAPAAEEDRAPGKKPTPEEEVSQVTEDALAVRRKSTARSSRSSNSNGETVIPEVLSPAVKPVVGIAGATIETDDPSHLFWVPAHLHPELHPSDFTKWISDSDTISSETSAFQSGKKPLRRSKSFVERHIMITPDNAEDYMEPENIVRSRTVGGTPQSTPKVGKGLPPLKRSRNIRPKRPSTSRGSQELNGRKRSDSSSVQGVADVDKEDEELDQVAEKGPTAGRRQSKKAMKKRRASRRSQIIQEGEAAMAANAAASGPNVADGLKPDRPFSFMGITPVELPRPSGSLSDASKEEEERDDTEGFAVAVGSNGPPSPVGEGPSTLVAALGDDENVVAKEGRDPKDDDGSGTPRPSTPVPTLETPPKGKNKKTKHKDGKSWNWLGFLNKRPHLTSGGTVGKHSRSLSADSTVTTSGSSGDDDASWDPYPQDSSPLGLGPGRLRLDDEKYVYRISHIKLAEHRRPLAQQVLISNLMLYILSVHADVTMNRNGGMPKKRAKKGKRQRRVAAQQAKEGGMAVEGGYSDPAGASGGLAPPTTSRTHPLAQTVTTPGLAAVSSTNGSSNAVVAPMTPQQQQTRQPLPPP
ncbi:hypothetical protein HKX48_007942, partial [Thoreauomyces humboldtii]